MDAKTRDGLRELEDRCKRFSESLGFSYYFIGVYLPDGRDPAEVIFTNFPLSLRADLQAHGMLASIPLVRRVYQGIAPFLWPTSDLTEDEIAFTGRPDADLLNVGIGLPIGNANGLRAGLVCAGGHLPESDELRQAMMEKAYLFASVAVQEIVDRLRPENQRALTAREFEVLDLVGLGMSGQEISSKLDLHPRTVQDTFRRVMNKLGTQNRAQTLVCATAVGLIRPAKAAVQ